MTKHDSKTADELILENAPEGATHHSQGMHYLSLNSSNNWMRYDPNGFKNAKWFKADDYLLAYCNKSFRSLADITELVELRKKNAELEKVFANVLPVVAFLAREGVIQTDRGLKAEFDEWLAIRDLEQKAQACYELASEGGKDKKLNYVYLREINNFGVAYAKQAKRLKGGDS